MPCDASARRNSAAVSAAYAASAIRASSGSATASSQSSSVRPIAPMMRTCGKCTCASTKPGRMNPPRQSTVSRLDLRRECRVVATRDDAAFVDQQAAVLMTDERPAIADVEMQRIVGRVENGCAEQLHYLSARTPHPAHGEENALGRRRAVERQRPRRRRTRAIASRSASRTENASINGGSPTALLPITTSGCVARSSISTLNTSGTSDHEGSL